MQYDCVSCICCMLFPVWHQYGAQCRWAFLLKNTWLLYPQNSAGVCDITCAISPSLQYKKARRIRGSHSGDYEEFYLLAITLYIQLKANGCYGHLKTWYNARILRSSMKQVASSPARHLLHAGFLPCLFFDLEDGGDIFLWHVGWISTVYMEGKIGRACSTNGDKMNA
jgi:hypothetical protein